MKIILLAALICMVGCAPSKVTPLKGNYFTPPYQIKTEKTFSQVWDKLVDMFAQNGIPIKIIDRSSGLIIAGATNLSVTAENKLGALIDPKASIVTNRVYNWGKNTYVVVNEAKSEWNVRVREVEGGSLININIVAVEFYEVATKQYTPLTVYKSTGNFEKIITGWLNN